MFRTLREGSERIAIAASSIGRALDGVATALERQRADGERPELAEAMVLLAGRVDQLEAARPAFEARMEAELIKVGSRHSAARSAEERARKAQERLDDEEEEGTGRAGRRTEGEDAAEGEAEGLQPVHQVMEVDPAQIAIRRKFGVV